MPGEVKSAARVLDVLELFSMRQAPLTVTDVARKLGFPKSSTQGLLTTLAGRGYLAREGVAYLLPPELRSGGYVGGVRARLVSRAEPILQRMARESKESAFLGALVGHQIQYLSKELSRHEVRYDAPLARARPVYCTSIGIAILAHLEPPVAARILNRTKLVKITPNTVTSRDAIDRTLERTRRTGYAEVKDANVMGASGIAAPVFGARREVLGALSIGAPTGRYERARKRIAEIVVAEAEALSQQFLVGTEGAAIA
jgi:DNA-binding IclR family transcriptional regulator